MLVHLSIRDIVLIDTLDLSLSDGLTVLTGETGAGKSILLDAFALALGARGDGALVRHGSAQGQVIAMFDLAADHPAARAATAHDIAIDGELILRRVQMADGRTRAFVNDQPVSAQALRTIVRSLVEIHGQHDDRALVNPAVHRQLLDAFGGLDAELSRVRQAHETMRKLRAERAAEQARVDTARSEADYLRHAHAELTRLAPELGEEAVLAEARGRMMQAEKVAAELRDAFEAVAGDHSPTASLSATYRRLDRRRPQAPDLIDPPAQALDAALAALDLAGQALEQALRDADFDPRELERVRSGCSPCAAPAENMPSRPMHWPISGRGYQAISRRSMPARRSSSRCRTRSTRPKRPMRPPPPVCRRAAPPLPRVSTRPLPRNSRRSSSSAPAS